MKIRSWFILILGSIVITTLFILNINNKVKIESYNNIALAQPNMEIKDSVIMEEIRKTDPIVFDDLTEQQLTDKINKSLNSDLKGKANLFVSYSLDLGLDPYLAVAITLHETGCKWNCSSLMKKCNNVGGQKGSPSCNGGSYKRYDTLEEGIKGYLDNLYKNYIAKGLTTPETIGPKYAASTTWASKINKYIDDIKNTK